MELSMDEEQILQAKAMWMDAVRAVEEQEQEREEFMRERLEEKMEFLEEDSLEEAESVEAEDSLEEVASVEAEDSLEEVESVEQEDSLEDVQSVVDENDQQQPSVKATDELHWLKKRIEREEYLWSRVPATKESLEARFAALLSNL